MSFVPPAQIPTVTKTLTMKKITVLIFTIIRFWSKRSKDL